MHQQWVTFASAQAGVISGAQLRQAGVTRYDLESLIRHGVLRREGRGVFACALGNGVDHWEQQLWVAVIQAGDGAVACRQSAAAWWSLDGCPSGIVEVAIPPGRQSRLAATVRPSHLPPTHVTTHRGLPVTTVVRTIGDLGSSAPGSAVERAMECALRRKLVTVGELEMLLASTRLNGSRTLREVLDARPPGAPPTESDAETLFLQLARGCRLSEPRRQYVVILRGRKYRLDFAWPDLRIAVEIDGAEVHSRPSALRSDLLRQNRILLDGWVILRYTWYDLVNHPHEVVSRDLLSAWTMKGGLVPKAL